MKRKQALEEAESRVTALSSALACIVALPDEAGLDAARKIAGAILMREGLYPFHEAEERNPAQ